MSRAAAWPLVVLAAGIPAAAAEGPEALRVVFFGDSLTGHRPGEA
jgi:hypothetical protein